MSDPLGRWVAFSDDEQSWAIDAMEYDREQDEEDEREIAALNGPLASETSDPDCDCC